MKSFILNRIYDFLGNCAKRYIKRHNPKVIGFTGSVGKTSCRMVCYSVFKELITDKKIYTSPKNFNSELGLVFSVFKIEHYTPGVVSLFLLSVRIFITSLFGGNKYDILLLEYGIDKPGDMDFLVSIVQPDYAIFTQLDRVHGEFFADMNQIGEEKFKLFQSTKLLSYLNYSDEYCRDHEADISNKIMYHTSALKIDEYELVVRDNIISSHFSYNNMGVETNLIGEENAYYIALGLNIVSQINNEYIKDADDLSLHITLQPGRFSILDGIQDSLLIDSSYNASPVSMKKMIENTTLIRDTLYKTYKIICVIGDMRELGVSSEQEHQNLEPLLEEAYKVFTVGSEMKKHLNILNSYSFLSAKKAGEDLKDYLIHSNDKFIILFKGSQNTIFIEEVVKQVLENPDDQVKLVRQSDYWLKKKKEFFND